MIIGLLLMTTMTAAADSAFPVVSIDNFGIRPGETREVTLCLTTTYSDVMEINGEINLPPELSFVQKEAGFSKVTKVGNFVSDADPVLTPDGKLMVWAVKLDGSKSHIPSGRVVTFTVKANSNLGESTTITLQNFKVKRIGKAEEIVLHGHATVTKLADIVPVVPSLPAATITSIPVPKTGLVYTGAVMTLANAGAASGGTLQYSLDNSYFSTSIPTATDAGEYTVYFKAVGDASHSDSQLMSINVTIGKAAPTFTAAKAATNLVYNGTDQVLVTGGTVNGGLLEYSYEGFFYSPNLPVGKDAGEYQVYQRVVGDVNHTDAAISQVLTVKIAQVTSKIEAAPQALPNLVYNGRLQEIITPGDWSGGDMVYSLDGEHYSIYTPSVRDAGEYTVYYKVRSDANHTGTDVATVKVTVASDGTVPGPSGPDDPTPTPTEIITKAPEARTGLVRNGVPQELVVPGEVSRGTMVYSADNTDYTVNLPVEIEAGSYTIYYKVVDSDGNDLTEAASLTATIAPAPDNAAVIIVAPLPRTELTYTGFRKALIEPGQALGGTMTYSLDGEHYATDVPRAADAGEYTVYYRVEGDDSHASLAPATLRVTIEKSMPIVMAPAPKKGLEVKGEPVELLEPGSTTGGTMEYSLDGKTYSTAVPTVSAPGQYTVYYRVVGDSNHKDYDGGSYRVKVGGTETAIEGVAADDNAAAEYYDLQGRRLKVQKKGVNIVRDRQGRIRKMFTR